MWWNSLRQLTASLQAHCQARVDKVFAGYCTLQLITKGSAELTINGTHTQLSGPWIWPHNEGQKVLLHASRSSQWWEHRHLAVSGPPVDHWLSEGLWPTAPQRIRQVSRFRHLFDEHRHLIMDTPPPALSTGGRLPRKYFIITGQRTRSQQSARMAANRAQSTQRW